MPTNYAIKKWEEQTSICSSCFKEVSNKAYFGGSKGSAHLRGTCLPSKSPYFLTANHFEGVTKRDAKKAPYPMPRPVNYDACKECLQDRNTYRHWKHTDKDRIFPKIQTYRDLANWWRLPTIDETQTETT